MYIIAHKTMYACLGEIVSSFLKRKLQGTVLAIVRDFSPDQGYKLRTVFIHSQNVSNIAHKIKSSPPPPCKIWDSHSGADKDSILQGCYTVLTGKYFQEV